MIAIKNAHAGCQHDGEHEGLEQDVLVHSDALRLVAPSVDLPRAERAVRELLMALGEDPEREGLLDTPRRVAKMYAEVFAGRAEPGLPVDVQQHLRGALLGVDRPHAADLLGQGSATLEDLLDALWMIAAVDGFHEAELAFLGEVATILGFDEAAQARIRRRHLAPAADDPWAVLGVEPGADAAALRAAYHALVKRYHPDRALAEGVPSEFIRVSELRMADINAAYDRLTGRRR